LKEREEEGRGSKHVKVPPSGAAAAAVVTSSSKTRKAVMMTIMAAVRLKKEEGEERPLQFFIYDRTFIRRGKG